MADAFPIPTHHRFQDLTGERFGRLTVSAYAGSRAKRTMWRCLCDCGGESVVERANLKAGRTKSCGCYFDETLAAGRRYSHRLRATPEYDCWAAIIQRCENPNNPGYSYYGGRGIYVCTDWRDSFETFYLDMGPRPSHEHSIDRYPDNDGPYSPSNCRWATKSEQAYNRRPKAK